MMKKAKHPDFEHSPVFGLSDEYSGGLEYPMHTHECVQLLYASIGVMSVVADDTAIVLPPQRALWIPAGVLHNISCRGPVSLRTLYIDTDVAQREQVAHVVEVGHFLRALIIEITEMDRSRAPSDRDQKVIDLLLLELSAAPKIPHMAPMPGDPRLLRVCNMLVRTPADRRGVDELAQIAGMSRRSFTRRFKEETGMSLSIWRQQIRLQEALSLLLAGTPVNVAANKVGYESASAFCSVFYRTFGVSPGKYIR
ncbi:AraC family transcriptional regulator [Oceanospirillum sediminis]|uniref:Helix-turn-helix transcriptional regulator n=1 Tax=Oceanospirillum sediminis TaxID=2760088 RepID=A0A839IVU4_9GAMM|nr:helix-turn-helix transcriptional regulator [Oceanospirillum sediminis]MBB1489553.1 helix-turn-helix transcriptional regulator [Oceanospirillum sediminis]